MAPVPAEQTHYLNIAQILQTEESKAQLPPDTSASIFSHSKHHAVDQNHMVGIALEFFSSLAHLMPLILLVPSRTRAFKYNPFSHPHHHRSKMIKAGIQ